MTAPTSKKMCFDFYQCEVIASQNLTIAIGMDAIFQNLHEASTKRENTDKQINGRLFDLSKIEKTVYGYRGIIGKYRKSNLPHAAFIRGEERELFLHQDEYLVTR